MCSWVLRTFKDRSIRVMKTLWSALIQPILDYCSQLWCPIQPGLIRKIEQIQQAFTRKIKLGRRLDYWERLKSLRMYSQERRRERYRIIYTWKILEGQVPHISDREDAGMKKLCSPRNGTTCAIPPLPRSPQIAKLREASILLVRFSLAEFFVHLYLTIKMDDSPNVVIRKFQNQCYHQL